MVHSLWCTRTVRMLMSSLLAAYTATPRASCKQRPSSSCSLIRAFAATGAMEGAWAMATGSAKTFSQQYLMDCTWDYGEQRNSCLHQ